MTGFPNFQKASPMNSPNANAKMLFMPLTPSLSPPGGERVSAGRVRGFFFTQSKMQFQQTDFERERLLDVGVQQPLGLFERLQIFQRLARREAARDGFRARDFREIQQFFSGGQRVEPDVAKSPLDEQQ